MRDILWVIAGLTIGTVFHNDIPFLSSISGQKVKGHIATFVDSVMEDEASDFEETTPEIAKESPKSEKLNRKERKALRKSR